MKKYTDEQLSRILSASAAGILGAPGIYSNSTACIEQAAFADNSWFVDKGDDYKMHLFDIARLRYKFCQSLGRPQFMLQWMEKKGMA